MTEKIKRPAFQFYPADWRKDLELQSCGIAARGLWVEMMCVMHEAEPYGFLTLNGKPMTDSQAASACRVTPRQYRELLGELQAAGVPGKNADGAIYSKRMVRDEALRLARAEGGKSGAEHGAKGADHGKKGGRPKTATGVLKPPLKPSPSSSSSASTENLGAFAPPDWVPVETWTSWLDTRKKKRTPNTAHALKLAVGELEKLRAAGHDPKAVLEQSILKGYTGLFEPKGSLFASSPPAAAPRVFDLGNCQCGAPATIKVGNRPRCAAHVRGYPVAA